MSDGGNRPSKEASANKAWVLAVPFRRVLRLGSRGSDARAVKRALARAFGDRRVGGLTPLFGPYSVRRLKKFQKRMRLRPTGLYGPKTHELLLPWFDSTAGHWYGTTSVPVPPHWTPVQLPEWFKPTHPTAGLPGYSAIDVFGKAGQPVASPCAGEVTKLSGHDPQLGGKPGGPYGWSIYIERADGRGRYYLTHFGTRDVQVGDRVVKGDLLGTICDSAISGKPNTSHIHEGYHSYGARL